MRTSPRDIRLSLMRCGPTDGARDRKSTRPGRVEIECSAHHHPALPPRGGLRTVGGWGSSGDGLPSTEEATRGVHSGVYVSGPERRGCETLYCRRVER